MDRDAINNATDKLGLHPRSSASDASIPIGLSFLPSYLETGTARLGTPSANSRARELSIATTSIGATSTVLPVLLRDTYSRGVTMPQRSNRIEQFVRGSAGPTRSPGLIPAGYPRASVTYLRSSIGQRLLSPVPSPSTTTTTTPPPPSPPPPPPPPPPPTMIRHPNTSSSASSSSSTATRAKKRRFTREQLLKSLEILGSITAPLPPTLPPSPPASRASSPAPNFKRKHESSSASASRHADSDYEHAKRPRTSAAPDWLPPSSSHPHHEGSDAPSIAPSSSRPLISAPMPVRRPRRGRPPNDYFDPLQNKYHIIGRILKYSGEARFQSSYPTTHPKYRPLPPEHTPPVDSPYHQNGLLIARLELLDALVCFVYSMWSKDYVGRMCAVENWRTVEAFLSFVKEKWSNDNTFPHLSEREKAFVGLIWMLEGFIHTRKYVYQAKKLDVEMEKILFKAHDYLASQSSVSSHSGGSSTRSQPTPPMLPSPASITTANSANSTPTNTSGTPPTAPPAPLTTHLKPPPPIPPQHPSTSKNSSNKESTTKPPLPPLPPKMPITLMAGFAEALKAQSASVLAARWSMTSSQSTLTLPTLATHFPATCARIVHSTLAPTEEHEPDIEDAEGELGWPGQAGSGEGLGWVCLLGKAMVVEFGKEVGYRGLKAVVPKPEEPGAS